MVLSAPEVLLYLIELAVFLPDDAVEPLDLGGEHGHFLLEADDLSLEHSLLFVLLRELVNFPLPVVELLFELEDLPPLLLELVLEIDFEVLEAPLELVGLVVLILEDGVVGFDLLGEYEEFVLVVAGLGVGLDELLFKDVDLLAELFQLARPSFKLLPEANDLGFHLLALLVSALDD